MGQAKGKSSHRNGTTKGTNLEESGKKAPAEEPRHHG